jgi:hypothetical protein
MSFGNRDHAKPNRDNLKTSACELEPCNGWAIRREYPTH